VASTSRSRPTTPGCRARSRTSSTPGSTPATRPTIRGCGSSRSSRPIAAGSARRPCATSR
jgi:hypothetical protein